MKNKILRTIKDSYGEYTPIAVLTQEDGLLRLWEVVCFSSRAHNLGNCNCINHDATEEYPVSTKEVIQRFGIEALDGFEAPREDQLIFDAFGVEAHELETYLRISYAMGNNPLPALREKAQVVFSENPDLLHFPDAEPGSIIFSVNSQGEISVIEV